MSDFKPKSPNEVLKGIKQKMMILHELEQGLNGQRKYRWGENALRWWLPWLADLGFTLKSRTALEREGYRLKRDAKPVVEVYFPAPIGDYCEMYILECHAVKKNDGNSDWSE